MLKILLEQLNRKGGHIQTLYPHLFRKVSGVSLSMEMIESRGASGIEVFWKKQGAKSLVILSHGMEGHVKQPYMLGMTKTMFDNGYDVLSWNLKGCEKSNNSPTEFYHGGAMNDLEDVVLHAIDLGYENISLIGFSLGANITLRYLGEKAKYNKAIKSAIAISCPCDLESSTRSIDKSFLAVYSKFFLKSFRNKLSNHHLKSDLDKVKTLMEFNDKITTQLNGFMDERDYYDRCSSIFYLKNIKTPVLILNALNDPFLSGDCYPYKEVEASRFVKLETPSKGGHVGFYNKKTDSYFSEERSLSFIRDNQ